MHARINRLLLRHPRMTHLLASRRHDRHDKNRVAKLDSKKKKMSTKDNQIIESESLEVQCNHEIRSMVIKTKQFLNELQQKNDKTLASMKRPILEMKVGEIAAVDTVLAYADSLIYKCIRNQKNLPYYTAVGDYKREQIELLQEATSCTESAVRWLHTPYRPVLDKRLIYYLTNRGLLVRTGSETSIHIEVIQNQLRAQRHPWIYLTRERKQYRLNKKKEEETKININDYQTKRMTKILKKLNEPTELHQNNFDTSLLFNDHVKHTLEDWTKLTEKAKDKNGVRPEEHGPETKLHGKDHMAAKSSQNSNRNTFSTNFFDKQVKYKMKHYKELVETILTKQDEEKKRQEEKTKLSREKSQSCNGGQNQDPTKTKNSHGKTYNMDSLNEKPKGKVEDRDKRTKTTKAKTKDTTKQCEPQSKPVREKSLACNGEVKDTTKCTDSEEKPTEEEVDEIELVFELSWSKQFKRPQIIFADEERATKKDKKSKDKTKKNDSNVEDSHMNKKEVTKTFCWNLKKKFRNNKIYVEEELQRDGSLTENTIGTKINKRTVINAENKNSQKKTKESKSMKTESTGVHESEPKIYEEIKDKGRTFKNKNNKGEYGQNETNVCKEKTWKFSLFNFKSKNKKNQHNDVSAKTPELQSKGDSRANPDRKSKKDKPNSKVINLKNDIEEISQQESRAEDPISNEKDSKRLRSSEKKMSTQIDSCNENQRKQNFFKFKFKSKKKQHTADDGTLQQEEKATKLEIVKSNRKSKKDKPEATDRYEQIEPGECKLNQEKRKHKIFSFSLKIKNPNRKKKEKENSKQ